MARTPLRPLVFYFPEVESPTSDSKRHLLLGIIVIVVCAAICAADTWTDVELFDQGVGCGTAGSAAVAETQSLNRGDPDQ